MFERIKIGDDEFVPFLPEEKIQKRIKELAEQISEDYKSTTPETNKLASYASFFESSD